MNNTDRDRAIDLLLRSRRADARGDACIDAESLAAWMEGGLAGDTRARVEQHAADCARCQALLASMARTAPEREDRRWWRGAMAKWVVPVAAAAAALVVWVAVERNSIRSSPPQIHGDTGIAVSAPVPPVEVPNAAPPPAAFADKAAPPPRARGDESTRREADRLDSRERSGGVGERAQQSEPRAAVGGIAGGQIDAIRPQGQSAAESVARGPVPPVASPVPSPPPPAPVSPLPAAPSASAPPAASAQFKTAPPSVAEAVTVTDATASTLAAAGGRGGGGGGINAGPREITSPDPNYRWRIVPPGSIQRSTDAGRTWAVVDPIQAAPSAGNPAPAILTTGSSPARDVCWIVGHAGVVLQSTDGATWHRRQLPESVDLIGVLATDATRAVVTTVDGRQFGTTDAGVTWIKR